MAVGIHADIFIFKEGDELDVDNVTDTLVAFVESKGWMMGGATVACVGEGCDYCEDPDED